MKYQDRLKDFSYRTIDNTPGVSKHTYMERGVYTELSAWPFCKAIYPPGIHGEYGLMICKYRLCESITGGVI